MLTSTSVRLLSASLSILIIVLVCGSQSSAQEQRPASNDDQLAAPKQLELADTLWRKSITRVLDRAMENYNNQPVESEADLEKNVEKMALKAFELYKSAASKGDSEAQYKAAMIYKEGRLNSHANFPIIDPDPMAATDLFKKSADQGNDKAQFEYGMCHLNGTQIPKNDKEAVAWLKRSSSQGNALAQEVLGLCFAKGEGIEKDFVQAYMWFNLAASAGNEDCVGRRERTATFMTPKQIEKAQQLSREWKPNQ